MNKLNMAGTKRSRRSLPLHGRVTYLAILLAVLVGVNRAASGQSSESGNEQHPSLSAGGSASLFYLQYGAQKLVGVTGFVDADSAMGLGIEGEGRWLEFHQFANVHAETYMVGPRFHVNIKRFQPYAKGLLGEGRFNFPYNYASGTYLMIAAGGGVDYRLTRRWSVRVADVEYQDWPQFTFGAMTSVGISSGIRYRIF